MKVKGEKFLDIEKQTREVYPCPYCGKILIRKNSYRNHLLKSSICEIIRGYGYYIKKGLQDNSAEIEYRVEERT